MVWVRRMSQGVKSGKNKGKKPAAGGTKAKGGKKGTKGGKKGAGGKNAKANKSSGNSKDKEESSSKKEDKEEQCKSISDILTSCHPSISESCKCGTSMDYTVASIPRSVDWPISFPLLSATVYVSAMVLHLEIIVSRLSK